jgi:hypothetical protein
MKWVVDEHYKVASCGRVRINKSLVKEIVSQNTSGTD